ncbi:MAG: hypothetical protein JXR76_12500 [Deltaproteobacteria bacterium]|nr:hypothetical protein [Deltaproteobacteria bacterium]
MLPLNPVISKNEHSESDILNAALAGDARALREVLQTAARRIHRTAKYLCASESEREDVVQNALIEVARSLSEFQRQSSFSYWIDRVTLYTASKHIDKIVRRRKIESRT